MLSNCGTADEIDGGFWTSSLFHFRQPRRTDSIRIRRRLPHNGWEERSSSYLIQPRIKIWLCTCSVIINDFNPHGQICPGMQATHLAYSFLKLEMEIFDCHRETRIRRHPWRQSKKINFQQRYHKISIT